jgi:hypothetical protein
MTVAELEDRMGAGELARWALYAADEPFIGTRIEFAAGIIASTIANVNRGKTTPAFEPLDFMPLTTRERDQALIEARRAATMPTAVDEDDATLQRLVAAFGGGTAA